MTLLMPNTATMGAMPTRGRPLPSLRFYRVERLWTQEALAARSGVARNTVARIENDAKPAEFSTIQKLAEALGVTPADLMRPPPAE